jgi:hypothetical protein
LKESLHFLCCLSVQAWDDMAVQVGLFAFEIVVWIGWLVLPALTSIYLGLRLRRRVRSFATPSISLRLS